MLEVEDMPPKEMHELLRQVGFGHLGCVENNRPYVVPISIVSEGNFVYSFSMPGQKLEGMRDNPLVCLEIDEIRKQDEWLSVVVEGRYEELSAASEREHAHELLRRRAMWWEPGAVQVAGAPSSSANAAPVFYRINVEQVTGRMGRRG